MIYPNAKREKKLFRQGLKKIVGIDEVGRGAWAGPLVAVAAGFILNNYQSFSGLTQFNIKDSKLLSEKQRQKIISLIQPHIYWAKGLVSNKEIDQLGLARANHLAVERAINNLPFKPEFLLIDQLPKFKHRLPFQLIINGDQKVLSIALASILAKVTRDHIMCLCQKKYPGYFFQQNKGYGTKKHQQQLSRLGVCPLHRLSFRPVREIVNNLK